MAASTVAVGPPNVMKHNVALLCALLDTATSPLTRCMKRLSKIAFMYIASMLAMNC